MPDPRFFEDLGPATLGEIAELSGAEIADAGAFRDHAIAVAAPLDRAGGNAVSFFGDRRYRAALQATGAGACFVPPDHADAAPGGCARLLTREPQAAWARAAARLHRPRTHPPGSPAVHPDAELEEDVELGPGAVVGPGARVGRGTVLAANAVIGPGVAVGRD